VLRGTNELSPNCSTVLTAGVTWNVIINPGKVTIPYLSRNVIQIITKV